MRICWFNDNRLGLVKDGRIFDVTAALAKFPKPAYPPAKGDLLVTNLEAGRRDILAAAQGARSHAAGEVRFLSPVASPSKIIGVPVNYKDHVAEAQAQRAVFTGRHQGSIEEQGLFLKANSALVGASEGVKVRFPERRTDHEMELGIIIGRKAENVSDDDALTYIGGYAIALDMVVRGSEDRSFRKSIDTYAVLGPWLVTADEIPDPTNLNFSLAVNGEVRQKSNTCDMIMGIRRQIAWASSFYTLWPGDIIMSGTCSGVSQVRAGDVMHCEIEKIGAMDVPVR